MDYKQIKYNCENGVARIVLDRPDVLNALNRDMVTEIRDAAGRIAGSGDARALVIAGAGGNFAAGADIAPMADFTPAEARAFCFNDAFSAVEDLPVPVIAAITGYCLGGGLELALACDLRVCAPGATLGSPEIRLGIFPGAGGTQRLPRLVGAGRAKEMIYFGKSIDAQTALAWGLCDRVAEDPHAEAFTMAQRLAAGPTAALRLAKKAINDGAGRDIAAGLAREEEAWAELFLTADQKEGMRAFLDKRKPVFKGK
jgi:enoyl-CoA hydratase